jgi:8-oxo-dGTP pyrophosphatase MutT (NUDIX family)
MRTILPKNAKLIPEEAERVFQGKIFDVFQWPQVMFDGSFQTFEMLRRPDTVRIMAVVDDKIVVLKQAQPNSQGYFYDYPSGRHDVETETELDAAKRETLEETGMSFRNWKLIDVEQPFSKIEWFIYTYVAWDLLEQIEQNLDVGEKIEVQMLSFDEVLEIAKLRENTRFIPVDILEQASSVAGLLDLPAYSATA